MSSVTAVILISLAVFAVLMLVFLRAVKQQPDSDGVLSTVDGFLTLGRQHDLVLMGSSVVVHLVRAMESEPEQISFSGRISDRWRVIKKDQTQSESENASVYGLCYNQQMISDCFLLAEKYFTTGKEPKLLVLGVSPRAFSDSLMPHPGKTTTFKHLVTFRDLVNYSQLYLPCWQDKVHFILWRLFLPLHSRCKRIRRQFKVMVKRLRVRFTDNQSGGQNQVNDDDRFRLSIQEYKRRYKGMSDAAIDRQIEFLHRLLDLCKTRNINVLMMTMPLPEENHNLLPPGFYASLRDQLAAAAAANGAAFWDAASCADFSRCDFVDAAHLNEAGAQALLKRLFASERMPAL